ncbi:hypothetical protein Sme01_71450 [Sphaerisporangium melleum]|uniref:Uncharacterized protein n=1 Tax=Sphaerisporangium melleum TaxID=321316 RepID=A0A917RNW1_9ACTN|nr:hypothetical protein GCM10007964_68690 [Sphaerisporangium melleum]GII74669.1 hypothetical protein Sme01_71450 [Sphaerisporangium melleum]
MAALSCLPPFALQNFAVSLALDLLEARETFVGWGLARATAGEVRAAPTMPVAVTAAPRGRMRCFARMVI